MLVVRNLSKRYFHEGKPKVIFEDLSFELERGGRLALLGRNGQGKSTLIKILGGVVWPSSGETRWTMSSSWPLGFSGGFAGGVTGYDNIKFMARIYERPEGDMIERVDRFAELGEALSMPLKYYSTGMRARLAFGLSLAIEFDCYLIDEVISVGDALFREKCEYELFGQRAHRTFVIASHDLEFLRRTCTRGIVIESGRAKMFDDINVAVEVYESLCQEDAIGRYGVRA